MTEWVVFGTGTPAATNETDGPIAVSTGFVINDGGTYWCTGVEFYAASSAPSGVSVALWSRVTDESASGLGTLLASKTAPGAITPGVRNRIDFDTAVEVTAAAYPNGLYATMRTSNNYVATGAYFSSGPGASGETSGPITAYANTSPTTAAGFNGRFKVGATSAAAGYPTDTFNAGGYWVSPVITDVDPSGGPPVTGVLAATPPLPTSAIAGVEQFTAALATSLPVPTAALAGVVANPVSAELAGVTTAPAAALRATTPVVERPSGWGPLLDMFRQARAGGDQRVAPVACPRCGEPLRLVRGVRHCSFDGWRSTA
jgi:hypothetical protein